MSDADTECHFQEEGHTMYEQAIQAFTLGG